MLYQGNKDNNVHSERHRPLGILDSPTLARVERAMLRHDEGMNRQEQNALRSQCTQVFKIYFIFWVFLSKSTFKQIEKIWSNLILFLKK